MSPTNHAPTDPHARPTVLTPAQSIASLQQLLDFYAGKEAEYYARLWGPEPDERWDQAIESEWMRYRIETGSLRAGIDALNSHAALVAALEASLDHIGRTPHGEDCFVSDHYDEDPGNRCNCGKESLVAHIEEVLKSVGWKP